MATKITYTQQGDYLLPNLKLPEQDSRPIGLWGQQHLRYIKRSRPILYTNLLTKCKLNEYLRERVDLSLKVAAILSVSMKQNKRFPSSFFYEIVIDVYSFHFVQTNIPIHSDFSF